MYFFPVEELLTKRRCAQTQPPYGLTTVIKPDLCVEGLSEEIYGLNKLRGLQVMDREKKKDCMECRITGSVVCLGVSGYLASHLMSQPPPVGFHKYSIVLLSGGFLFLSAYRAVSR